MRKRYGFLWFVVVPNPNQIIKRSGAVGLKPIFRITALSHLSCAHICTYMYSYLYVYIVIYVFIYLQFYMHKYLCV